MRCKDTTFHLQLSCKLFIPSISFEIMIQKDWVQPLFSQRVALNLSVFSIFRLFLDSNLMGSLCLTMMYDIFDAHAQRESTDSHTDRTAYIVKQLMALLSTGISRTERDVSYYAERLNVSPKYLSATIKRVTGHSVTSYIDRHTVPILKEYLNDERLSLTQIA